MKNYLFTLFFVGCHVLSFAQLFEAVSVGRIVATRSDSRSVNFIDINNDDWEDVFISNGLEGGQNDLLYLNDGTGRFIEVRDSDIVEDNQPSVGASFGDYDNDGDKDAFVTNWYARQDGFFENSEGSFSLIANSEIAKSTFAEAAAWGDFNNDGLLDLYVVTSSGGNKNLLFKNLGSGSFELVDGQRVATDVNVSRSVNWVHINDDMFLDICVGNENEQTNDLYINNGDGTFSVQFLGAAKSTFTSSWGDIDNDGDFDVFFGHTDFSRGANNQLFRNDGDRFSQIISGTIHIDGGCTNGSSFGDYDNDGDLDLFVTNGFCSEQTNQYYENQGDGTMILKNDLIPLNRNVCSYGVANGDIDNDGFLDIMIANCKMNRIDSEPTNDLFRNLGNGNNWLKVKLKGVESNRDAIGAIVRIMTTDENGEKWQSRLVSSQTGYSGQNSHWVHFGLAQADKVDSLVINWPSGKSQNFNDLDINRTYRITEGIATSTSNIQPDQNFNFKIWPNPITSETQQLTVEWNKELLSLDGLSIGLFDVNGKALTSKVILKKHQIESQDLNIEIPLMLPSGWYSLVLSSKDFVATKQVIIQR